MRPYLVSLSQSFVLGDRVNMRDLRTSRSRRMRFRVAAFAFGLSSVSTLALGACASAPPAHADVPHRLSPSEEAEAIAAAKRHPIALTYERPRPANALPVAPPKVPDEPAPPEPPPVAEAQVVAPPPRDQVIIVGNDAPPAPTAPYTWPSTYVDEPQVWVDGAWVARPSWRAYGGVGVGVGVGGGWGWGGGWRYGYPRRWVAPRAYVPPPVVVVPSYRSHDRYHSHDRVRPSPRSSWNYSSPRREVYVAPRAPERSRGEVRSAPSSPRYSAPPARNGVRSSGTSSVRSAPSSRRAVRVR